MHRCMASGRGARVTSTRAPAPTPPPNPIPHLDPTPTPTQARETSAVLRVSPPRPSSTRPSKNSRARTTSASPPRRPARSVPPCLHVHVHVHVWHVPCWRDRPARPLTRPPLHTRPLLCRPSHRSRTTPSTTMSSCRSSSPSSTRTATAPSTTMSSSEGFASSMSPRRTSRASWHSSGRGATDGGTTEARLALCRH